MVSKIWVGSSGNWETAANWNPINKPGDTDDVHFTGDSVVDVDGSTLTAGNDEMGSLTVHPDYTGSIGTSGSKLIMERCDEVRFEGQGGKLFLDVAGRDTGSGNVPADGDVANFIINTPSGVAGMLEFTGRCTLFSIVGTTGTIVITSASDSPEQIDMIDSPNCTLTIGTNAAKTYRIRQNSGRIINNAPITATKTVGGAQNAQLIVTGGLFEHRAGLLTDVVLAGTGVIEHSAGDAGATDAIIDFIGMGPGSLFDGRKNRTSKTTKVTITVTTLYPGCTMLLRNTLDSYVVTTARNFGGVLDFETGAKVAKG